MGDYITDRISSYSISGFPDDYNGVADIYKDSNSEFIMAPFLRNHDQARVIDSFNEDFQMKMAVAMYLTLPGTPYIYYGEEIGMSGGKPDEKIREPFIWNSTDMSKNTSWEVITSDTSKVAVDVQKDNKESLLNFYKSILNTRNNYPALRYGEVKSIKTDDNNIMAMERIYEDETAYVLINGNDKAGNAEVPEGKYEVIYSNTGKKDTVKSNGKFEVDKGGILIMIKK
jgi:glycosidase